MHPNACPSGAFISYSYYSDDIVCKITKKRDGDANLILINVGKFFC